MNEEFQYVYDLLNKRIKNNTEIVTKETLGQDYVIHIAQFKQKFLIPNISKRSAVSEDNTLVRIHTSDNLIGCLMGYSNILSDKDNKIVKNKFENKYYINKVDFEYALKPNNKLVWDANFTDELWLLTYNKQTIKYTAVDAGYFVIDSVVHKLLKESHGIVIHNILINVKDPIKLNKTIHLDKGYYKVEIQDTVDYENKVAIYNVINYKEINKSEFEHICKDKTFSLENKSNIGNKLSSW